MTRGMTPAGILAAVARSAARFSRASRAGGSSPAVAITISISAGAAVATGISATALTATARTATGLGVDRFGAQRLAIRLQAKRRSGKG